mmetsp:Transcript_16331/g.41168  ORF Transcript_16331/g.41168 Transcript_16331/m.41168 type:complete len:427 (-) Transcript_16331:495-1775(-)
MNSPFQASQPIFLQRTGDSLALLQDVQGSLSRMKGMFPTPVKKPLLKNPCQEDITRTGCSDAQCLKRNAEQLSGDCAELLLRPARPTSPEPSPAPEARIDMINALLGMHEANPEEKPPPVRKMADNMSERSLNSRSDGFFTMVTTDGEGHSKTVSGPISQMAPTLPPELAELLSIFPDFSSQLLPDITHVFGSVFPMRIRFASPRDYSDTPPTIRAAGYPVASIGGISIDDEEGERSNYPIASVGGISLHEVDEPPRAASMQPVASIGGISLHEEPTEPRPPPPLTEGPSQHPCAAEINLCREGGSRSSDDVKKCLVQHIELLSPRCKCFIHQVEAPEKIQRVELPAVDHAMLTRSSTESGGRTSCLLMMSATFLLFFILLRKCLRCLCRPAQPHHVAIVVPPEQTSIKLVEPLSMADIKVHGAAK